MHDPQRLSFEEFVHAAGPRLLRTAWFLTGDPGVAEDLVQETFTRMYVAWPRIDRSVGDPMGYAHRTLTRLHIDELRRHARETPAADPPERRGGTGADRYGEHAATHVAVVAALATLGARERQVVVLRHLADLSERTVAETLGISVGTVKSSGADGLTKLRLALGEQHV